MILLALIAALSAGTTSTTSDTDKHAASGNALTAQVAAPAEQAQTAANHVPAKHVLVMPESGNTSVTRTRADVIRELEQAKADGTYDLLHQEFEGQHRHAKREAGGYTRTAGIASTSAKPAAN